MSRRRRVKLSPMRRIQFRIGSTRFAAFLIGAAGMAVVQCASRWFAGNDSYYHIKMARLLPEYGFLHRFPWLHWTIFRDEFVSHHHGYHVLLAPFAWLSDRLTGDMLWGGKVFSIVMMGVTAVLLEAILRALRVNHRLAWVLLLGLLPASFWMRQSYLRAPAVALPLMLTAILLMLRRRHMALALLAFVFAHVYGGSVLFPLLPITFWIGTRMAGDIRPFGTSTLMVAIAGFFAGLVVNPYFPQNLSFLKTQILQTGLGAPREAGIEWKPYSPLALLWVSAPMAIVWVFMLISRLRNAPRMAGRDVALFLLNLAFLALTLKARRFIEYWPVFLLLSAASFSRMRGFAAATPHVTSINRLMSSRIVTALFVGVFLAAIGAQLSSARRLTKPHRDYPALQAAMQWLEAYSPPAARVFTDDWDIFPAVFFFNHHNTYCVGLDPVFTQTVFPALWKRYALITQGKTPAALPDDDAEVERRSVSLADIAGVFGTEYVLVADDHPVFYRQLMSDLKGFERVYPPGSSKSADDHQPRYAIFLVKATRDAAEPILMDRE